MLLQADLTRAQDFVGWRTADTDAGAESDETEKEKEEDNIISIICFAFAAIDSKPRSIIISIKQMQPGIKWAINQPLGLEG